MPIEYLDSIPSCTHNLLATNLQFRDNYVERLGMTGTLLDENLIYLLSLATNL